MLQICSELKQRAIIELFKAYPVDNPRTSKTVQRILGASFDFHHPKATKVCSVSPLCNDSLPMSHTDATSRSCQDAAFVSPAVEDPFQLATGHFHFHPNRQHLALVCPNPRSSSGHDCSATTRIRFKSQFQSQTRINIINKLPFIILI